MIALAVVLVQAISAQLGAAPPVHPGWPSSAGINAGAPISADLNGDGKHELLWGVRFELIVRSEDGRLLPGWPRSFLETPAGPPSVTLLDGAPIVGIFSTDFNAGRGQVSLWRANGEPLPGWPKTFNSTVGVPRSFPVVFADVDGDARPEVIYISNTTTTRPSTAILNVDRIDGTPLPGWPVSLPELHNVFDGPPAVADVDGDGRLDIAVASHEEEIFLYHDNGVLFPGWPVSQRNLDGITPAQFVSFADVNGDGQLEVVALTGGRMGIYNSSGQALPGWPRTIPSYISSPAFADLENDGKMQVPNNDAKLEIAFGTENHIYLLRADGAHFPGWPKAISSSGRVVLADLDSDQKVDVLATDFARNVYAWNSAGNPLTALGFPFQTGGNFGGGSPPSVADVDRDGLIEFFAMGGDQKVYVWDLPTTFNPFLMRSPTPMGGNEHTSRYAPIPTIYTMERPVHVYSDHATQFTVHGTGFLKGMRAFIGDREQLVSNVTATTMTVTANNVPVPLGSFALYPLRVENINSGSSEPLMDAMWVWRGTTPPPSPTPTPSPSATARPALTVHRQSPGRHGLTPSDGVTTTLADDFQFTEDTFVTRVRWWGGYYNPPPVADYFTLRIFADAGGRPGALIRTLDFEPINKRRTGASSGTAAEFEYSADLRAPFLARGGVKYWLSIVNPPDSVWGWDISDDENFERGRRSSSDPVNGPWESYAFDAAFQLESTAGGLANISTRGQVGTGDDALIVGFITTGSDPTKVLLRALGPSLSALGVTGALADPILTLYDSTGLTVAHNNDWKISLSVQGPEIQATGLAPTDDREAAALATLKPNTSYTVVIHGLAAGTGIALAEVYDLHYGSVAKLANISTRGLVQSGDGVMISGFVIRNPSGRVIVRALGPSLQAFGIANALGDPFLELRDSHGALVGSNDSWRSEQEAEIIATNAPPSHDLEAAIVKDLPAGAYTGIIRNTNSASGIGLIEVYDLDP